MFFPNTNIVLRLFDTFVIKSKYIKENYLSLEKPRIPTKSCFKYTDNLQQVFCSTFLYSIFFKQNTSSNFFAQLYLDEMWFEMWNELWRTMLNLKQIQTITRTYFWSSLSFYLHHMGSKPRYYGSVQQLVFSNVTTTLRKVCTT